MSWYIMGAYFSPMLPILIGAKENTSLGLNCYSEILPFPINAVGEKCKKNVQSLLFHTGNILPAFH